MCRKFVVEEIQAFKQGDTVETSSTQFNSGSVLRMTAFTVLLWIMKVTF